MYTAWVKFAAISVGEGFEWGAVEYKNLQGAQQNIAQTVVYLLLWESGGAQRI